MQGLIRRNNFRRAALMLNLPTASFAADAAYPNQPIRMIVQFAPAGALIRGLRRVRNRAVGAGRQRHRRNRGMTARFAQKAICRLLRPRGNLDEFGQLFLAERRFQEFEMHRRLHGLVEILHRVRLHG